MDNSRSSIATVHSVSSFLKASASLVTASLPLWENWQPVLPIASRARDDCLIIAVLSCILAVVAGYATGRHTREGLTVGWLFLILFMIVLLVQLGITQRVSWAERPLYILVFTFFSLSISSFLAYSARRSYLANEVWMDDAAR